MVQRRGVFYDGRDEQEHCRHLQAEEEPRARVRGVLCSAYLCERLHDSRIMAPYGRGWGEGAGLRNLLDKFALLSTLKILIRSSGPNAAAAMTMIGKTIVQR